MAIESSVVARVMTFMSVPTTRTKPKRAVTVTVVAATTTTPTPPTTTTAASAMGGLGGARGAQDDCFHANEWT